ncbi:MAG TPA: hypothetical protein VIO58_05065 [Candidatus Methanoperedens sp.]
MICKNEDKKYIFLLLPLSVIPDLDTFVTQHRALLHNIFIPLLLFSIGLAVKEKRMIFLIASGYLASHVVLDMFGGGVVLFYPFYNEMAFVDASLSMSKTNELMWTFNYGFGSYGEGWMNAWGYISESPGTAALMLVFLAGVSMAYRNRIKEDAYDKKPFGAGNKFPCREKYPSDGSLQDSLKKI